ENMVETMINKFELAPDTPAVHYARAAIALSKKDEAAAKEALTNAEKTFSPQLNKLFAESLYEVGFLEKPAGQARAALELTSAAEQAAKNKALAKAKFDEAEQALQQRDLTAARRLIDEADAADPNQAAIVNLRGEILLEQRDFDRAEEEFKRAAKLDPKYRDAQYNLALIPFKKGDYVKARERFESLFSATSGADKDRAAQLIKYKVYLTYLLEGKDARAQKMMEQFQFTGDTPALYYAQAAWEFKHGNAQKANDWVTSARKIYSPALNGVFSDAFYDLGWLQPAAAASPAPAVADAGPTETVPLIEPTPLPTVALAQNTQSKAGEPLTQAAQQTPGVPGMEATNTSSAAQTPAASSAVGATASPSVETPVASTASPAAARPVVASSPEAEASPFGEEAKPPVIAAAPASPATVLAPARVREWTEPTWSERLSDTNTLLVGALLLAAILLISWAVIPELRRRFSRASAQAETPAPAAPLAEATEAVSDGEEMLTPARLAGGPPQVSLQLRASEPALRRAVMPGRGGRTFIPGGNGNGHAHPNGDGHGNGHTPAPAPAASETETFTRTEAFAPAAEETFEEAVGEPQPVLAQAADAPAALEAVMAQASVAAQPVQAFAPQPTFTPEPTFTPQPIEPAPEPQLMEEPAAVPEPAFAAAPVEAMPFAAAEAAPVELEARHEEEQVAPISAETAPEMEVTAAAPAREEVSFTTRTAATEEEPEPVGQGQPIPYLAPVTPEDLPPAEEVEPIAARADVPSAALADTDAVRHPLETSPAAEPVVSAEPSAPQPITPAIMPTPTPTTPVPTIRTGPASPMSGVPPQPATTGGMQQAQAPQAAAGGMHTAVQLTFSFEIASLQLTPQFKMGALQLKPTSRVVTMRLAPSQHPQPAMSLQVTFEVATVQLAGNSLGMLRLNPSQAQRPGIISSPSFNIAGLQLVSGEGAAPVQLTPSQQGQASVLLTGSFQIATVEFSPSFEIASIVLNSVSKQVHVQLPGAGAGAIEASPVFEITNVQLAGSGEIGMVQLHPAGGGGAQAGGGAGAPGGAAPRG
ncbi:MAG TPA: tetratricopeptide repeat protein, partial [Chthoniobacterales bacterium]|nr:tetratricopeptide repeat protein [Chthoniobacterales bacterium]